MHHIIPRTIETTVKHTGYLQNPLNSTAGFKYVNGNTINTYYYSISSRSPRRHKANFWKKNIYSY